MLQNVMNSHRCSNCNCTMLEKHLVDEVSEDVSVKWAADNCTGIKCLHSEAHLGFSSSSWFFNGVALFETGSCYTLRLASDSL